MELDLDQVFSHIKSRYPWILRNYWTPVLKSQDITENKYISKFGGCNPLRGSNFQWPKCGEVHGDGEEECGRQKFFCCQINIGDLPDEMKNYIGMDSGMFQIFQCGEEYYSNSPPDLRLIPKKDMIPSLKTMAAINIFKKNVNPNKLPDNLIKFVEDTNEEFDYEMYDFDESEDEEQIQMWRKSEVKEIPSSYELKSIAIDDELLQSVPDYDFLKIKNPRMPISTPEDSLATGGQWPTRTHWPAAGLCTVKLFGYIRGMGGEWRKHYPQCLDCGLEKNVTFLRVRRLRITLCPGCGKPGSVRTGPPAS